MMTTFQRRNFIRKMTATAGAAFATPLLFSQKPGDEERLNVTVSDPENASGRTLTTSPFSAIIGLNNDQIFAVARGGKAISSGKAGRDDAKVFQDSIDYLAPSGGEIRITRGRYKFTKTVLIDIPVTLTGEGQNTVIVPPPDDYVFNITTTERSPLRPNSDLLIDGTPGDNTLHGVTIQMLTIDGEKAGKGLFMKRLFDCIFQNLWIQDIHRGSALHLDWWVCESNFINIHLNSTGCKETRAASIHLDNRTINNLHFNRVFTIFPESRGLQVNGGTIIYFNDCMWHGHFPFDSIKNKRLLPGEWPTDFSTANISMNTEELIYVKEIGYDKGLIISRPRITNNHPDYCHVVVEKGEVAILDGIIGGGAGAEAMIRAESKARMRITGNHFEGFPNFTPQVFQSNGAEAVFRDNVIEGRNKSIVLSAAQRTIIAGNRFSNSTTGASLRLLDKGNIGCNHVIVTENIFQEPVAKAAIQTGPLSKQGTIIRDNFFTGNYEDQPEITA